MKIKPSKVYTADDLVGVKNVPCRKIKGEKLVRNKIMHHRSDGTVRWMCCGKCEKEK